MNTMTRTEPFEVGYAGCSASRGIDLMRLRVVRALIQSKGFPYLFQVASLAALLGLAVLGWGLYTPEGANAKLFAKSNLVTLVIWGIWWPVMVWAAVLFGRVWCAVCPLELVSNISERLGRLVGIPQRALRKWMLSGGVMLALYVLIQLLVAGAHINRVPAYTSMFLLALFAAAATVGLFFKDRAFCRGFCPVGLLLSVYGRGGTFAVRSGEKSVCSACPDKACKSGHNRQWLDARSCPSLLNPPQLDASRDCLLCGQCLKSCGHENMSLLLRMPYPATDRRELTASWPTTLFIMVVSGFVLWELTTEWPAAEAIFVALPERLAAWIGLEAWSGLVSGLWALLLVPITLWTAAALTAKLAGDTRPVLLFWRQVALPISLVVAAGHMSKGLAKLASWIVYLPYALDNPTGLDTIAQFGAKTVLQPQPLISMAVAGGIGTVLVVAGFVLACRELRLVNSSVRRRHYLPLGMAAALALAVIVGWPFGVH